MSSHDWYDQLTSAAASLPALITIVSSAIASLVWAVAALTRACGKRDLARAQAELARAKACAELERANTLASARARAEAAHAAMLRTCENDPNRWSEFAPFMAPLACGEALTVTYEMTGTVPGPTLEAVPPGSSRPRRPPMSEVAALTS